MKKLFLITLIPFFIVSLSCKKTYHCKCDVTIVTYHYHYPNNPYTPEVLMRTSSIGPSTLIATEGKTYKKEAKSYCQFLNGEDWYGTEPWTLTPATTTKDSLSDCVFRDN